MNLTIDFTHFNYKHDLQLKIQTILEHTEYLVKDFKLFDAIYNYKRIAHLIEDNIKRSDQLYYPHYKIAECYFELGFFANSLCELQTTKRLAKTFYSESSDVTQSIYLLEIKNYMKQYQYTEAIKTYEKA